MSRGSVGHRKEGEGKHGWPGERDVGCVWSAGEGVWGWGGAESVRGWSDAERWSPMQMERLERLELMDPREPVTGAGCRGGGFRV